MATAAPDREAAYELEYAAMHKWAADARARHQVDRMERKRRRQTRRRWAVRLVVLTVFCVLGYLAWVRFGTDPMRSVQP